MRRKQGYRTERETDRKKGKAEWKKRQDENKLLEFQVNLPTLTILFIFLSLRDAHLLKILTDQRECAQSILSLFFPSSLCF